MQRLKIAKRELRSFMSDIRDCRGCSPEEVVALALVREALALLEQAELKMATHSAAPELLSEKLKRIG